MNVDMTQTERTERLREVMRTNKLNAPAVGKLLNRSAQTVRSWRSTYDKRAIPALALELLEVKLAARVIE